MEIKPVANNWMAIFYIVSCTVAQQDHDPVVTLAYSFIHPSISIRLMTSASASRWLRRSFSQALDLIGKLHLGKGRPHGNPSFDLGLTLFFQQPWCHGRVTNPQRDPHWEQLRTTRGGESDSAVPFVNSVTKTIERASQDGFPWPLEMVKP